LVGYYLRAGLFDDARANVPSIAGVSLDLLGRLADRIERGRPKGYLDTTRISTAFPSW
jgi:hypothetical protein